MKLERKHKNKHSKRRLHVVYWTKTTAPYMLDRFNALATQASFTFEVWISDRNLPDRSWHVNENDWLFQYRYIPTVHFLGRALHSPFLVLSRRPDLLAGGYSEPSRMMGWIFAKSLGIKTAFRVLNRSATWVKRNIIKEWIKRVVFRYVDAVETPGEDGKNYAVSLGCAPEKIHFATHTVAAQFFSEVTDKDAMALREKLGCRGITFIYVGRLWKGKGVQYLLDAFGRFQKSTNTETTLLLVGDGVDEESFRKQCADRQIQNVVFAGFAQRDALTTYYKISDVFVFPTLGDPYGIVVDEAMACSLPVLSTSAAGEIAARVEEGVNGYIVQPADGGALADGMLQLAENKDGLKQMGEASRQKVLTHTPEQWAKDFQVMVESVFSRNEQD